MATLHEYKCKSCGYTVNANSEHLKKWNPKTGKCPKCGGGMEKTDIVIMAD